MARLKPSLTIDCPRCGLPIHVLIEAGPVSVGTSADGKAEAFVNIRGVPQPHTCKGYDVAATHETDETTGVG